MLYGEQWICKCGTHNLTVRSHCRTCGGPQTEKVGEEDEFQVTQRVFDTPLEELKRQEQEFQAQMSSRV